jgi:acyl-CoA thioesterase FadM
MAFEITFPTRHTDAFAGTGFVHAGILLALTELAYAAFEEHCGVAKPGQVYAVQRATEATYAAPLAWKEGATVRVRTVQANERGFDQEFEIVAASDGRRIALFVHHWVWLDTETGKRVAIDAAVQRQLLAG